MPPWQQGPSNALSNSVNLDDLRELLSGLSDADLIVFGKQMRGLVYPLRYDGDGKPQVSAFSIQLNEARAEWRRRHPHPCRRRIARRVAWRCLGSKLMEYLSMII
jgi:hypothetical protein